MGEKKFVDKKGMEYRPIGDPPDYCDYPPPSAPYGTRSERDEFQEFMYSMICEFDNAATDCVSGEFKDYQKGEYFKTKSKIYKEVLEHYLIYREL